MKTFFIIAGIVVCLVILSIFSYTIGLFKTNVTDSAFIRYEEYQEIFNTCQKLNTDLGIIKGLSETDKMFEQFSKEQRISTIKMQLNRWVEDYNAKSKMWNRSLWKSGTLPYQLSVNQFSNY